LLSRGDGGGTSIQKNRLMSLLRAFVILFAVLSCVAISARSEGSGNLAVRAIRWFLGLDETDEFAIPLESQEWGPR
jgi:hypothetical protein